jgi:hypothetical protein
MYNVNESDGINRNVKRRKRTKEYRRRENDRKESEFKSVAPCAMFIIPFPFVLLNRSNEAKQRIDRRVCSRNIAAEKALLSSRETKRTRGSNL